MRFHTLSAALCAIQHSMAVAQAEGNDGRKECIVKASGTNTTDDTPAILQAFEECKTSSRIVFVDTTYYINSVMNVTGLDDVEIDIYGTLLWSTDIEYWLENSLDVGYQNQSTAFSLGGDNVRINGHGTGTFDGNGDYWYGWIRQQPNTSNYPGRPHALTFNGLTNSVVKELTFLRSQMWTMSLIYSHYVELDSILVNNTGNVYSSSNTDGADTIRSSHITFNNWTVYNGDDSLSLKADSTDITFTNCKLYDGLGIAFGSIGQYYGAFETIERIRIENITFENTLHAVYVKTWTGDRNGYPPNGGGGGEGYISDVTIENLYADGRRGGAFTISQCTRFQGAPGDGNCTNSGFEVRDVTLTGLTGTSKSPNVASLQCSAVKPCTSIGLFDVDLKKADNASAPVKEYLCGNALDVRGFECTGKACEGGSSTGECKP